MCFAGDLPENCSGMPGRSNGNGPTPKRRVGQTCQRDLKRWNPEADDAAVHGDSVLQVSNHTNNDTLDTKVIAGTNENRRDVGIRGP